MKEGTGNREQGVGGRAFSLIVACMMALVVIGGIGLPVFAAAPKECGPGAKEVPAGYIWKNSVKGENVGRFLVGGCGWYENGAGDRLACYHSLSGIVQFLLSAYNLMLGIVGSLALLMFVWGGLQWLTSGGTEKRIQGGMTTLRNALIGLGIVFGAWIFVNFIVATLNPTEERTADNPNPFLRSDYQWFSLHKDALCYRALTTGELTNQLGGEYKVAEPPPSPEERCVPGCDTDKQYCYGEKCTLGGTPPGGPKCENKRGLRENCREACVGQCLAGLTCKRDIDGLTKCLSDISAPAKCSPPCNLQTHFCYDSRYGLKPPEKPSCEEKLKSRVICMDTEQCQKDLECRLASDGKDRCLDRLPSGPIAPPTSKCSSACSATQYCYDDTFIPKPATAQCVDKKNEGSICQKPGEIECKAGLECRQEGLGPKKCLSAKTLGEDGICVYVFGDKAFSGDFIADSKIKIEYDIEARTRTECAGMNFFGKHKKEKRWCKTVLEPERAAALCKQNPSGCCTGSGFASPEFL